MLLTVTVAAAGEMLVLLIKVSPPAGAATPLATKTEALAEMKVRVPPAFCTNAKVPEVLTVQVPAVTVQTPAAMFSISTTSEAPKIDVFTVMVVGEAEFMTTLVPRSAIVRVWLAVLVDTGSVVIAFICAAVRTLPEPNGNGVAIMLLL